jgi:PhnB protein
MSITTTPHLNFRGQARAALEYYQSVFGGDLSIATYRDIHAVEDDSHADDVAFGQIQAASGFRVMAYDVQPSKQYDAGMNAFYITLHSTDADTVTGCWARLADEGRVLTPLVPAAFAPLYGMLTDRFGITWIFGADDPPTA